MISYTYALLLILLLLISSIIVLLNLQLNRKLFYSSVVLLISLVLIFIWRIPRIDDGEIHCTDLAIVDSVTKEGFYFRTKEYDYKKTRKEGDAVCLKGIQQIRVPYLTVRGWTYSIEQVDILTPILE